MGGVARDWRIVRTISGRAYALKRMVEGRNIFNLKGDFVNQNELEAAVRDHEEDLTRQFGPGGYKRLYSAVTRGRAPWYYRGSKFRKAVQDTPREDPHESIHPSKEGIAMRLAGLLRTYKPVGNVPIWEYPPRAPITAMVGAPASTAISRGLPSYVDPIGPGPVTATDPRYVPPPRGYTGP